MTKVRVLSVACPVCKAIKGKRCHSGAPFNKYVAAHAKRAKAAGRAR